MQIDYGVASFEDLTEICFVVSSAIETMLNQNIFQWDDKLQFNK